MSLKNIQAEDLINYSEAARILGVTRVTIYAMIGRGELTPTRIADRRYLNREEVEKLRNEKTTLGNT